MRKHFTYLILFFALGIGNVAFGQSDFSKITLKAIDGTSVKADDFLGSQGLVLVFFGNHCVYAKKYEARLLKLAAEYEEQGVEFLFVNSNDPSMSHENSVEQMAARATENQYTFPYLIDHDHELADAVGAKRNPEVFLYRSNGETWNLSYSGAIDDNPLLESAVKVNYLRDAISSLLMQAEPVKAHTDAKGCAIKRID